MKQWEEEKQKEWEKEERKKEEKLIEFHQAALMNFDELWKFFLFLSNTANNAEKSINLNFIKWLMLPLYL